MAKSLIECEYRPGEAIVVRINPVKLSILPESTRSHVRAARKEMLLAVRSLLDEAIAWMERKEAEKEGTGATSRTNIEVQ